MGYCKIQFIGNLGRDPEMRFQSSGQAVTQFSVAVNQGVKNKETGEWSDDTDWYNVSVWGQQAERAAESLRKGNKVFVEGRFKTREYEAKDGTKRTSLDVNADSCINLATAEAGAQSDAPEGTFSAPATATAPRAAGQPAETFDDLPF